MISVTVTLERDSFQCSGDVLTFDGVVALLHEFYRARLEPQQADLDRLAWRLRTSTDRLTATLNQGVPRNAETES